jgi:ATP-dependent Clp protease ATP-binding subunit ClpC
VVIEPPTLEQTAEILKQIIPVYELFHGVKYDNVIPIVVDLAERYIADRFFPDKAIDVVDEAGALAKLAAPAHTVVPVTEDAVRKVVSTISNIPVTDLNRSERDRLARIDQDLKVRLIGQDEAVEAVSNAIKRRRTGVSGAKRPSSFLFVGPTGVGKTELARQLAIYLFDSIHSMIRLDMSEFYDRHTISSLIGAPPGYIGYDDGGGKLSEKVRKKPYSVILLDELEKAHQDIVDILLQILDDGELTDAQGRLITFKNTILIMTSNVGSSTAKKRTIGFTTGDEEEQLKSKLKESLKNVFKIEFLNRIDEIVAFNHLTRTDTERILDLQLKDINAAFDISMTPEARTWFVKNGYSEEYGARPMRRLLERWIETGIANILLTAPDAKKFEAQVVDDKISVVEVH